MHRSTPRRAVTVFATGVLLLTACGDDSDDSDEESAGTTDGALEAFCTKTTTLQNAMALGLTADVDPDANTADDLADYAEELLTIEPPDDIADDWAVAMPVFADMLKTSGPAAQHLGDVPVDATAGPDALDDLDLDDPEAVEAVRAALEAYEAFGDEDVQTAGQAVAQYLSENCSTGALVDG